MCPPPKHSRESSVFTANFLVHLFHLHNVLQHSEAHQPVGGFILPKQKMFSCLPL